MELISILASQTTSEDYQTSEVKAGDVTDRVFITLGSITLGRDWSTSEHSSSLLETLMTPRMVKVNTGHVYIDVMAHHVKPLRDHRFCAKCEATVSWSQKEMIALDRSEFFLKKNSARRGQFLEDTDEGASKFSFIDASKMNTITNSWK